MNLLERVLTLLRANLNSVVEKSDDPEKALRQLQLDMRNQLVQVKTQVATAIAQSRKLQVRVQERKAEAETWMRKAEQAIRQDNDPAARDALTHYNEYIRQAQRYEQQQQEQEQLVITMRSALRQLEAKISEVETTIDLLVTRRRNALLQQRVFDALGKTGSQKDRERANRAQDAVIEAEARARAMEELHKRNLDTQLDQLSDEQIIERQLKDLKTQASLSNETPLLDEGNPHLSPLISPQPQNGAPAKKRPGHKPERPPALSKSPGDTAQELDIARLKKLMEE
ncbi:MAG TPA: PspA/IM30 family protein [Ktedonobacteraceae bacterium]|jgi:phage shock protein A|nr:PspA/IM30 family protein [Ktedonobacteraceae bacterium]